MDSEKKKELLDKARRALDDELNSYIRDEIIKPLIDLVSAVDAD